ncbi:MAG: SRPBCC domain-containing protein [Chloroflexi bacterium]|nr:SRPBCC domain-containing protein [Chloroflexota bacterium]
MADERLAARVRRVIHASPAEVFRAWTDPEAMAKWMSPAGVASATVNLRVGGEFRLVMADEHLRIEHMGVYREIDPPRRLVFTWRSEYTGMRDTLVTVDLAERGERETDLLLVHELDTPEQAASHEEGWRQLVSRLESAVA